MPIDEDYVELFKVYEVPRFSIVTIWCMECNYKTHWKNKALEHYNNTKHELTPLKEERFVNVKKKEVSSN